MITGNGRRARSSRSGWWMRGCDRLIWRDWPRGSAEGADSERADSYSDPLGCRRLIECGRKRRALLFALPVGSC